ncbi:MAG: NAD(P)(+) transhydrogenase (Re/Si-specific) subunit beta [Planctomycetes bacterium]|nr:NAD(P)(+) transhydrogenase (Re/Si-specific) subunit beta [Planctomycetota bacterium]
MSLPTELCYFVAAILFMLSLKWLASPKTARRSVPISILAMGLAVVPTFIQRIGEPGGAGIGNTLAIVLGGLVLGSAIGFVSATKVKMTAMPQMVGLYNGFGGAASLLVAAVEFLYKTGHNPQGEIGHMSVGDSIPVHLSILIGGICFTGSMAAFAKLQELISGRPVQFKGQHYLNLVLLLAGIGLAIALTLNPLASWHLAAFLGLVAIALVLGWLVVIPIGGADMPVVISLMNSYSGMAVTATGFVLRNNVLIILGSLVGASGLILTRIMCKAMNRSLANVMFGGFGAAPIGPAAATGGTKGTVKEASVEEAAMVLQSSGSLIVVPGYGMAVAQAQHAVRELAAQLEKNGTRVRYAIHPVAGRMPGHMNVLLAEANVPYDQLYDLDQINDDFANTDVVLVVGANDVVNPAAKNTPGSPIYGMPVFNCEQAKSVIVLKRSMNPGFAGIENELFVHPKTMMVFGDARQTLTGMTAALKEAA